MKIKAAGVLVSLVLALSPAVILWLQDQSDKLFSATAAGLAVVIINTIVKALQVTGAAQSAPEQVQYDPNLIPGSRGAAADTPKKPSALEEFLFG